MKRSSPSKAGRNDCRTWISIPGAPTFATLGLAAILLLSIFAMGSARANTVAPSQEMQWAYGGNGSFTYVSNGTAQLPMYANMHVWGLTEVVFTETNTSSHTVAIEIERAFAGVYFLQLCQPNCSQSSLSPPTIINMTFRGWGYENLFANFTDQATVSLNGQNVPAIGLVNSSVDSAGNVTLTENMSMPGGGGLGSVGTMNTTLYASTQLNGGHAAMSFSPALGIFPLNTTLNLGDVWSSTSQFSASAGGQASYHYDMNFPSSSGLPPQEGTGNVPVTFPSSGSISLTGGFLVDIDLLQGVVTVALSLDYSGAPVDALEGVLLVPQMLDIFGPDLGTLMGDNSSSGSSGSSTSGSGAMNASTGATDVQQSGSDVGVVGSETGYGGTASVSSSSGGTALWKTLGVLPAAQASHASSEQNHPESVSQATQTAQNAGITIPPASSTLNQGGSGSANGGAGGAGSGNPWVSGVNLYLVFAIAVVVVASLVLAVEQRRRKRGTKGSAVPPESTTGNWASVTGQRPPPRQTAPASQTPPPGASSQTAMRPSPAGPNAQPLPTTPPIAHPLSPVLTNLRMRVQRYANFPPEAREPERQAILRGAEALRRTLPAREHAEIYHIIAPLMQPLPYPPSL